MTSLLGSKGELLQFGNPDYKCTTGYSNIYCGCPGHMADGRYGTYLNSSSELYDEWRRKQGFTSENAFREYMINNGNSIIKRDRLDFMGKNGCVPKRACSDGFYTRNNYSCNI